MIFPDDLVKEIVHKLKSSGPEVSSINFTPPLNGMFQKVCIIFRLLLLTLCLLYTFPKRKLLLSASQLIWDKMVVLDSAVAGESSTQYFWIFTLPGPLAERESRVCFWKLRAKFSVPGKRLFSPSIQVAPVPLKTLSPKNSQFSWKSGYFPLKSWFLQKLPRILFSLFSNEWRFNGFWGKIWTSWVQNFVSECGNENRVMRPANPMLQNRG